MKNILFISIYPFPLNMGSKQHAYYFLKSLSFCNNVYAVFFIPPHQDIPLCHKENDLAELGLKDYAICCFGKTKNKQHGYRSFLKKFISFPNSYVKLATHFHGLQTINTFIKKYQIDIVHFEHFWLTGYAFSISHVPKKVIVYHDLHHSIYEQLFRLEKQYLKKLLFLTECIKFYIYENQLDKKVALKIFLNPTEMLSLPNRSIHIPHIVNPNIQFRPARKTEFFNILFIGGYNHPPNRRSVNFIIQSILPRLAKMQSRFKIHLIGPDTEKFFHLVNISPFRNHVTIHGFKKNINDAFREKDIALLPILDGGGIKTKIIDALAAGLPVVTTPQGLDGLADLPEDCIGVGDTPETLANELDLLMRSYYFRNKRAFIGRNFVDNQHSFNAFSNKVRQVYSAL